MRDACVSRNLGESLQYIHNLDLNFFADRTFLKGGLVLAFSIFMPFQANAECYEYDDLGRLINVIYDNPDKAQSSYNLDEHGNRITVNTTATSAKQCIAPDGVTDGYEGGPMTSGQVTEKPGDPPGNQDPIADDEDISMLMNSLQIVMPLEGDTDPDGDTLTIVSIAETSPFITATLNGEAVTIESVGFEGDATVIYTISDGNGGSAQGNINVSISGFPTDPPFETCFENGVWVICDTDF